MAIGSPDKTARMEQLRTYARCQVRSGYRSDAQVRAEMLEAVADEVSDRDEAERLANEFVDAAEADLVAEAAQWSDPTSFARLHQVFADIEQAGVVVLQAVEDHWAADEELQRLHEEGHEPLGLAFFTQTDVWHAVQHGMLELNVWHGSTANVAPGDRLLDLVSDRLAAHGFDSAFDEGRIEVTIQWQRRPTEGAA